MTQLTSESDDGAMEDYPDWDIHWPICIKCGQCQLCYEAYLDADGTCDDGEDHSWRG